jgi:hypothetical protein
MSVELGLGLLNGACCLKNIEGATVPETALCPAPTPQGTGAPEEKD